MEMLMENKSGERDDLGSGKKLTRKRKGDGVSVFTFKGRE
jgi:hypothetical protein